MARDLFEETDCLYDVKYNKPEDFAGNLSVVLGLELAAVSQELLHQAQTPEERFGRLQSVLKELSQLRRDIDRGRRTKIAEDRWFKQDFFQDEEFKEKQQEKVAKRLERKSDGPSPIAEADLLEPLTEPVLFTDYDPELDRFPKLNDRN